LAETNPPRNSHLELTNGEFQVDIGFPWQMDFSRSFTLEVIVVPGVPVLGAAGFYFGKLSGAATNKVPVISNGWLPLYFLEPTQNRRRLVEDRKSEKDGRSSNIASQRRVGRLLGNYP
jgi:hypothetical protein